MYDHSDRRSVRERHGHRDLADLLFLIIELEEMHMSAIDNLNATVSQLTADVAALIDKVQSTDQSPAIQSVADSLTSLDAQIKAAVTPPAPPSDTFVVKLAGESYADYISRVVAHNASATTDNQITAEDEATWTSIPV